MMAQLRQISLATLPLQRAMAGLTVCAALAALATGLTKLGGSGVIWGLLLGLAVASVWTPTAVVAPGIGFAGKHLLRIGVALLGFQISAATLQMMDAATIAVLAANVALILAIGWIAGPLLGLSRDLSMIAAASVAICGASAAAAFAIVLKRDGSDQCDVGCTIGAVSIMSSAAMLAYPMLGHALGLDTASLGVLLGGTIHEVAHAIAAGYSVDPLTGEAATIAKLLRVAMLAPATLLMSMIPTTRPAGMTATRAVVTLPPGFLIAFVIFAILNIAGLVPTAVQSSAAMLSRFFLVMAMVAIGLTLPWTSIRAFGWRPIALLLLLSAVLFATVTIFVVQR